VLLLLASNPLCYCSNICCLALLCCCTGVGGSFPSALNDLANGKTSVMPTRSAAKLENLAALEMPFELKALEVCLDSVSNAGPAHSAAAHPTGLGGLCFCPKAAWRMVMTGSQQQCFQGLALAAEAGLQGACYCEIDIRSVKLPSQPTC
jgi:hypothetical protein